MTKSELIAFYAKWYADNDLKMQSMVENDQDKTRSFEDLVHENELIRTFIERLEGMTDVN